MSEIEELRATVDAFCRFVEGLPEAALVEQEWRPKEVLAHLVFYHESYIAQVEALLTREPFEPPQGRFSDLNAQAVTASRGVPVADASTGLSPNLVRRFQAADERLCALHEAHDPTSIVLKIKQRAKPRTLAGLVPEIEAHVRNHRRKREREVQHGGQS